MPQLHSVAKRDFTAKSRRRSRAEPFELLDAKLAVPAVRTGIVPRPGLVNRLRAARAQHVVTIVAAAGYGKTTLLSQWAERDDRPFAWVTVDEGDDDPVVLLRYLAAALNRAQPIEGAVFDALGAGAPSVWSTAVPRLAAALSDVALPIVLVLDGVQALRSRESADAIATLARHVSEESTLVLAGRALPELPIARLRAEGRLFELGADELALSRREAELLLRAARVELDEDDAALLAERTEGWAAGLHLAGLFLQNGSGQHRIAADFAGDDRFIADYFRFEHLSELGRADVRFLTRSAVLDSMCGPLCDAVLGRKGSTRKLESLERACLFLVPLDRRRAWYRYHHLFREMLRAELERTEPELVAELNERASAWCEANHAPEAARRYAAAAGDLDSLARLVAADALPAYCEGRIAEIEPWLGRFDDPVLLERYPPVAALGSWIHALGGRADEAERWLEAAEQVPYRGVLPDGTRSIEPWTALLRAAYCRDGADWMLVDAEKAAAGLARESRWRPTALFLCGVALLLLGDDDRADAILAEADAAAAGVGATDTRILALSERSLLATGVGDHALARDLAHAARILVGDRWRDAYVTTAIQLAAVARTELRGGSGHQARAALEEARRLDSKLTHALPWYSVQTSLELARAHLALLDSTGAGELLTEAESILDRCPALGVLASQAQDVRAELAALRRENGRVGSMLTAAELRLLPLLTTRLSFREIGERLHVSRNTVKTQAIAVYRKLGVSSRNDAIDRAADLGLVDPAAQVVPELPPA
jgi:LuxR family maltose regulon positive regulatory protein